MQPEESPGPFFEYSPLWRGPEFEEDEKDLLDFDLDLCQNWDQRLSNSSRSQLVTWRRSIGRGPP